jgi:hypothetical protein
LRKRLREYYEKDGADHPVRIEIPPGQYAPQFLAREASHPPQEGGALIVHGTTDLASPDDGKMHNVAGLVPALPASDQPKRYWRLALAVGTLVVAAATGAIALRKPAPGRAAIESMTVTAPGKADEIRILAGHLGSGYTDRLGHVWSSDRYFRGGYEFETEEHPIYGTREPRIYQGRREGAFEYDIPLSPGVYELRLHFAETLYGENNVAGGGESSRIFNVYLNGAWALRDFDILNDAGPSTADVRAFKDVTPASDGKVHLKFEPITNAPLLCAIEITPGIAGRFKPVRMIALDRAYTDPQGRRWEPDQYARGGQVVARSRPVQGDDPELFRGERFGNLRYVIPVPPGRYGLTMHVAEAWFGPGTPPGGGVGSRLFDIFCNGVLLRRDFDVFKEAHGALHATTFTAHGLEPDSQGKLNIALAPSRNYACVNALEVMDETR